MKNNYLAVYERNDIKIGPTQVAVLHDLIGGDKIACWSAGDDIASADIVIIDEVPKGFQIEGICRAVSRDATVVIPYSENPQFDSLKSYLNCHGTIGSSAPEAPHHIWWGGTSAAAAGHAADALRSAHIVSCVRRQTHEERDALAFSKALMAMGISYTIDLSEPHVYRDDRSAIRSQTLLRAWEGGNKPLIWLDPVGDIDLSTINPTLCGADFAAIYEPGEGFSTALLYFGRSRAAHELLKHWNNLCEEFPHLPANFVLDVAWAMISAQRMLVTRWLSSRSCQSVVAGARAHPVAPSLVEQNSIECRSPGFRRARRAARVGAPEPQSILKGRIAGGDPITFMTVSEAASARDVAILTEDVLGAYSRSNGVFGPLAIVVCQDPKEAAEAIEATGNGWILFAWPGIHIDAHIFESISRFETTQSLVYLGDRAGKSARTASGQTLTVSKSSMVFGRGLHFLNKEAPRTTAALKLVNSQ